MRHRLPADALLLATIVIWSFNFTAVKYGLLHGFLPLVYATIRFGGGSAVFSGYTYAREGSLHIRKRDVALVLGAAGIGIYLNQMFFVYSVDLANASTTALVFGTLPIFVALIARLAGTEILQSRHWIAVGVSFGGVALVAGGAGGGLSGSVGGILLGLGAAATWAAYSVAIGPLMRRYSPYRPSAVVGLAAMLPLVITAVGQLARQDWGSITAGAWAALLYSMLLSFVLTNVLWFTAVERVGAARSSLYANLQPFLGAVIAVVALGETMGWIQALGGAVIAAGIVIARQARPPTAQID